MKEITATEELYGITKKLGEELDRAKGRIAELETKIHDHIQADPHPWRYK